MEVRNIVRLIADSPWEGRRFKDCQTNILDFSNFQKRQNKYILINKNGDTLLLAELQYEYPSSVMSEAKNVSEFDVFKFCNICTNFHHSIIPNLKKN